MKDNSLQMQMCPCQTFGRAEKRLLEYNLVAKILYRCGNTAIERDALRHTTHGSSTVAN